MKTRQALILLHLIVFLFGFTSILGKLISYDSISLVWWRLVIVNLCFVGIYLFTKRKLTISKALSLKLIGTGGIIAIHWVCFFAAIKVSNISIAMIAISSGTLFTAIIEPLVYKRKLFWKEVAIGIAIIITILSIALLDIDEAKNPILGILLGMIAALTAAIFSTFNGKFIEQTTALNISFVELLSANVWVTLAMLLFFEVPNHLLTPSTNDIGYLLVLGILCTAIPFVISVEVMKKLSPFTVNLTINLEIVYAIILGYFIFGAEEEMSISFYLASAGILALVFTNQWLKAKRTNKTERL